LLLTIRSGWMARKPSGRAGCCPGGAPELAGFDGLPATWNR